MTEEETQTYRLHRLTDTYRGAGWRWCSRSPSSGVDTYWTIFMGSFEIKGDSIEEKTISLLKKDLFQGYKFLW